MSLLDFALGFSGMDDATIAELDAALPGLGRLAVAAKDAEPFLTQAKPHLDALAPLLAQAQPHLVALMPIATQLWPKLQKAWPDVVGVTPTVQDLIAFANSRKAP
jgi:hypothetical protein